MPNWVFPQSPSFDPVVTAEVLMLPGHFIRRRLKTGEGGLVGEDSVVQLARLVVVIIISCSTLLK
jgi:hypothetical protein